jgi:hypothetical protein
MTTSNSIRDKYFAGELFKYGDIVEDIKTGEKMKILDRGSNYVTVAIGEKVVKRWLNEVQEVSVDIVEEQKVKQPVDFLILENGQIQLFGHITQNFDRDLSEFILEQFEEFDDLYSKHQIIKCLDYAIGDTDSDRAYDLLLKVESFYTKKDKYTPFIVEALKTDIERKRMAEIIASVAEVRPSKTVNQTITQSMRALREKYTSRKQWEVLWPLFKLAMASGIDGIRQNLPYTFGSPSTTQAANESLEDEVFVATLEENIDLAVEDLEWEDIECLLSEETELSEELLTEVLTLAGRNKLSHKMSQHSDYIAVRRTRALKRAASADVILSRARRLAEIMLKRRMFHKNPNDLNRQEKERFESGEPARRALVAKLATRLIGKVRALQNSRVHHAASNVTHKPGDHTVAAPHAMVSTTPVVVKSGAS